MDKKIALFVIAQYFLVLVGGDVHMVILNLILPHSENTEPDISTTQAQEFVLTSSAASAGNGSGDMVTTEVAQNQTETAKYSVEPFVDDMVERVVENCLNKSGNLPTPDNLEELSEMFDALSSNAFMKYVLTGFKYENGSLIDRDGNSPSFSINRVYVSGQGQYVILAAERDELTEIQQISGNDTLTEDQSVICERD